MDNWNGITSLLVACIELILIINMLALSEKTKVNKLAIMLVALLFIYQLLEFLMCHFGLSEPFIAYLAFVDISFLPPLGLYLILNFLEYPVPNKIKLIFIPAILFAVYYAIIVDKFAIVSCTVLYASYNYPLGTLYGAFYYLPIVITMILLYLQIRKEKSGKKSFLSKILLTGYIIISLPVVTAFILSAFNNVYLLKSIESIMCKFALVLALCYTFITIYGRKGTSLTIPKGRQ